MAPTPGRRVFDFETDLDDIADAYTAMDDRRAIKSLVRVGPSMAAWTDDELRPVGAAEELELASRRPDGTCGRT